MPYTSGTKISTDLKTVAFNILTPTTVVVASTSSQLARIQRAMHYRRMGTVIIYEIMLAAVIMQRSFGHTSFSAKGYLGPHTSTMDLGKHVAIKKTGQASAPQPFNRPEMNTGVKSYASVLGLVSQAAAVAEAHATQIDSELRDRICLTV